MSQDSGFWGSARGVKGLEKGSWAFQTGAGDIRVWVQGGGGGGGKFRLCRGFLVEWLGFGTRFGVLGVWAIGCGASRCLGPHGFEGVGLCISGSRVEK